MTFRHPFDPEEAARAWRARERPDNELPVAVPWNVVVGSGDDALAFITGATVYSNGIELSLEVRKRPAAPSRGRHRDRGGLFDPFDEQGAFHLALEYADGRRYVHGRSSSWGTPAPDDIQLTMHHGSSGDTSSTTSFYLTPVPPADHVVVHFAWPKAGIPKTATRIPTAAVVEAARQVRTLWPGANIPRTTRPEDEVPAATGAAHLRHLLASEVTPLVRTDFSDDEAWEEVVHRVIRPVDFDDPDHDLVMQTIIVDLDDISPDHHDPEDDSTYLAGITAVDDRGHDGLAPEQLPALLGHDVDPADDGEAAYGYVLLADRRSMSEARTGDELTVVYVDLAADPEDERTFPGRSFRVVDREIAAIEANLSIANMDFADFADGTEPDGVFRGFRDD